MIDKRSIKRLAVTNERVFRDVIRVANTKTLAGRVIKCHAEVVLTNEEEYIEYCNYNTALADALRLIEESIILTSRNGNKELQGNFKRVLHGIWYTLAKPNQLVDELELREVCYE